MKRIAYLFPGQGSQYQGMFKDYRLKYPLVKQTFEEAADVLGLDIVALCERGSEEELALSYNAQPVLLAAGVAAYRLAVHESGKLPDIAAGHSLGEYTALTCSGVLQYSDALAIVKQRGYLMQEAMSEGRGQMLAISGLSEAEADIMLSTLSELREQIAVACYNSADQLVLSGTPEALRETVSRLDSGFTRVVPLKVGAAFHSPLMTAAAGKLERLLNSYKTRLGTASFPVISNVTVKPYGTDPENAIANLVRQMTQPVRWKQTMAYLREENVESAVELGPGRTLKNLLQQDYPSFSVLAFDSEKDHGTLLSSSREALPLGEGNLRIVEACLAAAVATRNRNEDLRAYELGVIKPYREIEQLLLESEENGTVPTDDAIQGVLQRLMTIMQTKFVSEQEQRERLSAILPGSHSRKFPTPFNL